MQETQVHSLGWEDPLEEDMAIHSNILAWRIPWTEEPGGLHTVHRVAKNQSQLKRLSMPTHYWHLSLGASHAKHPAKAISPLLRNPE